MTPCLRCAVITTDPLRGFCRWCWVEVVAPMATHVEKKTQGERPFDATVGMLATTYGKIREDARAAALEEERSVTAEESCI
jgi:hypothetical protein